MEDAILTEITEYCRDCASNNCCPEEECVLFRIEKLVSNKVEVRDEGEEEKCDT